MAQIHMCSEHHVLLGYAHAGTFSKDHGNLRVMVGHDHVLILDLQLLGFAQFVLIQTGATCHQLDSKPKSNPMSDVQGRKLEHVEVGEP